MLKEFRRLLSDTRVGELLVGVIKAVWGVWLLILSGAPNSAQGFRGLAEIGLPVFGVLLMAIGSTQIWAVLANRTLLRVVAAGVSTVLWGYIDFNVWANNHTSPITGMIAPLWAFSFLVVGRGIASVSFKGLAARMGRRGEGAE